MKKPLIGLIALTLSGAALSADIPCSPSPDGARAYIISPQDGATVESPVTMRFGLSGMGVAPAGTVRKNTGHHHLLINRDVPDMGMPMGPGVKHFGGDQTEAVVELAPGAHTLQLLLGDHAHVPHDPPVLSEKITITVK